MQSLATEECLPELGKMFFQLSRLMRDTTAKGTGESIGRQITLETANQSRFEYQPAISKIGNGESRNGERGTGNGERGISKIGNI